MNGKFKNASTLSLAAMMTAAAAFGMAGAANAASRHIKAPDDGALVKADPATAKAIKSWSGGGVFVQTGAGVDNASGDIGANQMGDPQILKAIRADIRANTALTKHLEKQNININDIDGALAASDGSLILLEM